MIERVAAGLTYGLTGGLAPGATNALILTESLRHGAAAGCRVALSPLVTDAPIIAVGWWLAGLASRMEGAERVLAGLGGLVLFGLAVETWRGAARAAAGSEGADGTVRRAAWWKGVLANGLNPHPWIFWLTIGGPTLRQAWEQAAWAGALAFLAAMYGALVGSKMLLAVLAARGRRRLTGGLQARVLKVMAGVLLIFAVRFLLRAAGLG